jgi:hypothetical protein
MCGLPASGISNQTIYFWCQFYEAT